MGFHYPNSFYLLSVGLSLLILHMWTRHVRRRDLLTLGDWRLVQQLIPLEALRRRGKKEWSTLIAVILLIVAAAGPQWGNRMKEVKQRGVDVFIAVDTSRSMLAEDVPPSRMDKAKQSLSLLIQKLQGNRVGLIAFAKFAVVQCPLTVDTDAARMFLDILDTNTVPQQGTALGDAIRLAVNSFNKDDKTGKALVLLTDGEDHESDPLGAAKLAKEKGVVIFTVGIGTTKGEVIKKRDEQGRVTEFLKHKGEMVLSKMDDALLSKIASETGGHYYRSTATDQEIDDIADTLNGFDKKEFATKMYQKREERYQWFALLALLLLLLEFFTSEKPGQLIRIKQRFHSQPWQKVSLLLFICFLPSLSWADLKDHVRRGNALLNKKDFVGARGEFESGLIDAPEAAFLPYNIATTYYLEGNFKDAKKQYERALTMTTDPHLKSKIAYNLGHLTFSMGDRPGAIEKFKECLQIDPHDADAKYNIEYIRAGNSPKNPMKQKESKDDQKQQGQKGDKTKQGEEQGPSDLQKKEGELTKDETEQILELIKDEEKENQKEAQQMKVGKQNNEEKKESNVEDW